MSSLAKTAGIHGGSTVVGACLPAIKIRDLVSTAGELPASRLLQTHPVGKRFGGWNLLGPSPRSFFKMVPWLLLLLPATGAGAPQPMVHAELQTADTAWAGQRLSLVVELFAPGYFSSAATFDLPDPPGLIVMPPSEHPVVSGKQIDGTYFAVQRHELSVYAANAGEHTVPPIQVRFSFKRSPLDHDDIATAVETESIRFSIAAPPGTRGLGQVISARNLTMVETWKPELGKAKARAGDAFTRTITFSAPDVPGMVFPPFPTGTIEGLRLYPRAPALLDQTDNGVFNGGRRDTIVYVCERPGEFTIPAARLTWWDLDAKKLRAVDFPAHTINVAVNPALSGAANTQPPSRRRSLTRWWWPASLLAVGVTLFLLFRSVNFRQACGRWMAPLRPVHLQSLNPR